MKKSKSPAACEFEATMQAAQATMAAARFIFIVFLLSLLGHASWNPSQGRGPKCQRLVIGRGVAVPKPGRYPMGLPLREDRHCDHSPPACFRDRIEGVQQ